MINPAIENDLKRMSLNDVNYANYIKENYIQIPDNATNGDVIKAVFPNFEFYTVEHMSKLYSPQIKGLGTSGYFEMGFDLEWWNSPYKADKEGD